MKFTQTISAIAVAMTLVGGAQSAGVSASAAPQNGLGGAVTTPLVGKAQEQQVALVEAIGFAADQVLDTFANNYVTDIGKNSLSEYLTMVAQPSLKLPAQVDNWFSPIDSQAKKYKRGDADAGRDLFLRLQCLAAFQQGFKPAKDMASYASLSISQAEAYHYTVTTKNLHFANLFAAEIAKVMPNTYKTPEDFLSTFVTVLNHIPNAKLQAIYAQAQADAQTAMAMTNGYVVNVKDANIQNWQDGLYEYSGSQDEGLAIKKNGQPIFGQGYIDGRLYEVVVASNAGAQVKTGH